MKNYPIVAVCSGKGGVGKSTLAFNLAKKLSENNKVGLIDADIYGPSLHLFFNNIGSLKPEIKDDKLMPPLIDGVYFMSGAFLAPGGAFIRAPKATAIVKSFFDSVVWDGIDILIVDFPPGTGDISLTLFQEIIFDAALLITTPHTLSVEDSIKSGKLIIDSGIPIIGVIENMSYMALSSGEKIELFGAGGGQEVCDLLKLPLLASLPHYKEAAMHLPDLWCIEKNLMLLIKKFTPCFK